MAGIEGLDEPERELATVADSGRSREDSVTRDGQNPIRGPFGIISPRKTKAALSGRLQESP
jgi:hypothetical protein